MERIIVNRTGISEDSYMKTLIIEREYTNITKVTLSNRNFIIMPNNDTISNHEKPIGKEKFIGSNFLILGIQLYQKSLISGLMAAGETLQNFQLLSETNNNNILGVNDISILKTEDTIINIPYLDLKDLQILGCQLIAPGDSLTFKTPVPLYQTIMSIGKNYINDYILNPDYGGGIYLERHDTPHIHIPLDDTPQGFITLGYVINDLDEQKFNLLYFGKYIIPKDHALFIPPNIYHNDCFLRGTYRVLYTVTDDYYTGLLRNSLGHYIRYT